MRRHSPRLIRMACAMAVLTAGCSSATPPLPPSQSPSAPVAEFTLEVTPTDSVGRTIGGQRVVFLVTVSGSPADGPVDVAAEADRASVTVQPVSLLPGVVGEVTVEPEPVAQDMDVAITISAYRGGVEDHVDRSLGMSPGEDGLAAEARAHLAPFLGWLDQVHPELGIDERTDLEGTPGSWVLVVAHYQFHSEEWEIGLAWHVMIPPDDWARIYLRRRWSEVRPSRAFEISSVSSGAEPHEVDPPGAVWR
jgi:hypothetical protein